MRKKIALVLLAICSTMFTMAKDNTVTLRILETSDVHGSFFPYDFINQCPRKGSMARVSTYVNTVRQKYGKDNVILLENGDILQGQPVCYYYNYIKTKDTNIAAEIVNYLQYDAQTFGNHDIETGHNVYDKWANEIKCPTLGANIINTQTGHPYVRPYVILNRKGVKIAILGMITPAIPNWLKEGLWSGLHFQDMVSTAQKWIKVLREEEKADVVIGLFHSGWDGGIKTNEYTEDASKAVAQEVSGFDAIFFGHDHKPCNTFIENSNGKDVLCLDPANNAMNIAQAEIVLQNVHGRWTVKKKEGTLVDVRDLPVDENYMKHFQQHFDEVNQWVTRPIGTFTSSINSRDCFFGSSAFTDFIHQLQIRITHADISFNAPLLFDATIKAGPVTVADMFNLYKFENQLYVMRLTGEEIRRHLEMSYDLWVNTMKSPTDHLLQLNEYTRNDAQRMGFKNFSFNFDSAYGIDYEVDVTRPDGEKVHILQMSNGQPFNPNKWYKVAVNSYRGNGGGELLTRGAGIPRDSLQSRIIWESKLDQRYYLMEEIEKQGTVNPQPANNWKFVPENWTKPAALRDRKLLYKE